MNVKSAAHSSYLAQMQNDTSGKLSNKDKYGALMQQIDSTLMNMLDTNKNGFIDKAEFSDMAKKLSGGNALSSNTEKAFSAIDANKDDTIDANELMQILEQLSAKNKAQNISARLQENINTQSTKTDHEKPNEKSMQTTLMKNILSAYTSTYVPANVNGVNLKA